MLVPNTDVVLRRLAPLAEGPWLLTAGGARCPSVRAWGTPDAGWRIHDADDGTISLESLSYPRFWLYGGGEHGVVFLESKLVNNAQGLRWRVHQTPAGTFQLECLGGSAGRRWLAAELVRTWNHEVTERPDGRSKLHEFVALPASDRARIVAAEAAGDFSHLARYGVSPDGVLPAFAPPPKPKPPLTSVDPVNRSKGDPVREELIAALLPSFEDGDACLVLEELLYRSDDPRRAGWPHNVVSLDTVALSSGTVCLSREPIEHDPDPAELPLCRWAAADVVAALGSRQPLGGDPRSGFRPFYSVIGRNEPAPAGLTADAIRAAFHGTLFPDAHIRIEPFLRPPETVEAGGQPRPTGRQRPRYTRRGVWRGFNEWAVANPALREMACVQIDADRAPCNAAVALVLVVGLTQAGSLAGACGCVSWA